MKLLSIDERLLLLIGLAMSGFAGFTAFRAVPAFSDVFKSFGANLPLPTELILRFYPALLALPVVVLLAWAFWPTRKQRGVAALATAAAVSIAVPLLLALVMYLPIIALGQ